MNFINRETDYALQALRYIEKDIKDNRKKIFTIEKISQDLKLPKSIMRKIFQILAKNNILCSITGKTGGFTASDKVKKITMLEVMNIFQGELDLTNCYVHKMPCRNRKKCSFRDKLIKISKMVELELMKIKFKI